MTQNLTVPLDADVLHKAKVLAMRRASSVSSLVAEHITALIREDEAYLRAGREALAMLEYDQRMGTGLMQSRLKLHVG